MSAITAAIVDCITGASADDRIYTDEKQALISTRQVRSLEELSLIHI